MTGPTPFRVWLRRAGDILELRSEHAALREAAREAAVMSDRLSQPGVVNPPLSVEVWDEAHPLLTFRLIAGEYLTGEQHPPVE